MDFIKGDLETHVIAPVMHEAGIDWDNAEPTLPYGSFPVVGGPMGVLGLTGRDHR